MKLFRFFQSRRARTLDACLDTVMHDVSGWFMPPRVVDVALVLQREADASGIVLRLPEACKLVRKRLRV